MEIKSPGGFVFGIQGYEYGEVKPRTLTFFTDGTVTVGDHRGNPIREYNGSHKDVIDQLRANGVDWQRLEWVGWPQLPYDELKELDRVPPTPLDELMRIKDKELRLAAIKLRQETDEIRLSELQEV